MMPQPSPAARMPQRATAMARAHRRLAPDEDAQGVVEGIGARGSTPRPDGKLIAAGREPAPPPSNPKTPIVEREGHAGGVRGRRRLGGHARRGRTKNSSSASPAGIEGGHA